jgi:hypothetical protein
VRSELLDRALLYARTARHLRWEQWVYRPVRRVQRMLPVRLPAGASPVRESRFEALADTVLGWGPGDAGERLRAAEAVVRGEFAFLNHRETLPEIDWNRRYVSHLWSYNLHYFDYALDLAWAYRLTGESRFSARYSELADDWILGTAPGRGDGWEPYAISLRVVNWIYARLLFGGAIEEDVRHRIDRSLHQQLRFLERRLELHILANHLQKNLKALVVGGLYFSDGSAGRWRARGAELLWRELFEQVLPDGCHFERSPMYHAIALRDFLEVVSLLRAAGEEAHPAAAERVGAMVRTLGVLSRPDGSLHLFNDAAQGIAPDRSWIASLARDVLGEEPASPRGPVALPDGGYFGWVDPERGERLLVDCGIPGPSYQPGHAHCDLLSFELDLVGRPVVVDSGVSGYEGDPLREYARSTRAHNTVMIGGREQSEVWGTFRVARRARVRAASQAAEGDGYRFAGSCSPFHDARARHHRTIQRDAGGWTVTDRVEGARGARLDSFLHLHPDFEVEREGGHWRARSRGLSLRVDTFGGDVAEVRRGERHPAQGWHCPEFGRALPAAVLHLSLEANDGRAFGFRIIPEASS